MRLHSSQRKRTGPSGLAQREDEPRVLSVFETCPLLSREEGQGEVGVNESPAGGSGGESVPFELDRSVVLWGQFLPRQSSDSSASGRQQSYPAVAARTRRETSSTMATTRGPQRRHILRSACGRACESPSSTVNGRPRSTGPRCPTAMRFHVLSAAARN
ncbi:hypothetical protein GWK47_051533 [Chionoecetes opilio]|uniref:Uncharacterized protein n=1 Tax=Chionoecetes opilio TaxID=41210 RepID=A0A8J5CC79_CHIOP|nr:hypothetical protein GWK47_051533 [Chionoecetes opilio]